MIKNILILSLVCCFAVSTLQAQQKLGSKYNAYRAGDEILKQQVVFRDPGSSGKDLIWDFRTLQPINQDYKLTYFLPDNTQTNRLCGMEHRTRYYYDQHNDSLWITGYENPTTYMEYLQPELRMKYPFVYGDTLHSHFEGKGEYGRRLKLTVKGNTRVEADAEGELILPDETVKKALRIHTLRHYTETGRDSIEMQVDTYSWYATGTRYPVFESIKTSIMKSNADGTGYEKDTVVFETSFYYPPSKQKLQNEEEDESDLLSVNEPEGIEAVFTEAELLPNPVVNTLQIHYKLTRDAHISFSVYNSSGAAMTSTPTFNQTEGKHTTPVNMSGFLPGIYTLYVKVDDMIMSLNVIKK